MVIAKFTIDARVSGLTGNLRGKEKIYTWPKE